MDLNLKGKRALVTGGSKGIGKASAQVLAEEGCAVMIASRDGAALESAAAEIKSKTGADVKWKSLFSRDKYAVMDFNKELGKHYDAAAYATTILESKEATPIEIRLGSPNALQVFLNGKKLFEREEYHHGDNMDDHLGKGTLKPGPNVLVVKVCQNNQKDVWAQRWQFQARICDATGAPIPGVPQLVDEKKIKLGFVPPEEKK